MSHFLSFWPDFVELSKMQNLASEFLASQDYSAAYQHLKSVFGSAFQENEYEDFWNNGVVTKLTLGQIVWSWPCSPAQSGLYLVLSGKIRLLDQKGRVAVTLKAGHWFGHCSVFNSLLFQTYSARAGAEAKTLFIPRVAVATLIEKHGRPYEILHQQAACLDICLLSIEHPRLHSVIQSLDLESLGTCHQIPPKTTLSDPWTQKLWMLRSGQLQTVSKSKIDCGFLHSPSLSTPDRFYSTQACELFEFSFSSSLIENDGRSENSQSPFPTQKIHSNHFQDSSSSEASQSTPPQKIGQAYFPSPQLKWQHWWQRVTHRYPFYEQQSTSDCGAACLVMAGRYWGKKFNLNRLRDLANVDRNGTSLRGLSQAAESVGFNSRPVKASLDQLAHQTLPAIAHWDHKHFVVVFAITAQQVIICDPALGQMSLSHAAFKESWTGYALLITPNPLLKQSEETSQPIWQFFELIKPHRLILFEVFVASIFIQLFGLITPLLTQLLLDRVIVQQSQLTLTTVGLGMLLFGIFKVAMITLRQYLLDHTANRVDLSLIVGFISHTFRLPLHFFETRYVGDIISRIQENRKIQRFLTGEALSILLDFLTLFIYLGLMFWYSWKMALLTLVIVPPFVLLALLATPILQRVSRRIFNAFNEETGYLIQILTGIRSIKSMALEQTVRWHWESLFGESVKQNFSGQMVGNLLQAIAMTIEMLVTTALLWFGAWLVIQNELTIGQLVAFNMLLGNILNPFKRLTVLWSELQEVLIAVERINDVVDSPPEEDLQQDQRQTLPAIRGHIQFQSVTFRYHPQGDTNTIENLNLAIEPEQHIAIVGRSGSGKSTLAKLILGLYPPTDGQILIDGYDLATLSLASVRQQIGVVDQETFLLGGTIRENIAVGYPAASLEEVIAAAKIAGAHEFILALPKGYETLIGEGGGMLSGGQRQRLAIARAVLGNPKVLIFDEATSHLDTESERLIQKNLDAFLRQRTTVVIAHRLSTIQKADRILVLDQGIVVEHGTHQELMDRRGHYFYLTQQQAIAA